jgi:hypothetical protein
VHGLAEWLPGHVAPAAGDGATRASSTSASDCGSGTVADPRRRFARLRQNLIALVKTSW